MVLRTFSWSLGVTVVALVGAFALGGTQTLILVAILSILEISLSFDNAVINASVLERMSAFWQKIFLTIGVLIAVFGMRLVFPFLLVSATAGISPLAAVDLALAEDKSEYQHAIEAAHPAIAAFGGIFLLMIFLDFVFEEHDNRWLGPIEKLLAKAGKLEQFSTLISLAALVAGAEFLADSPGTVLVSGVLGLVTYLAVNGLAELFEAEGEGDEDPKDLGGVHGTADKHRGGTVKLAVGKAAFFLFLYLEVLDASFSFDGVVGAFAITDQPFVIALGLGVGAMYIRSLTVFLVKKGTLTEYIYLEHGAHWAIGALAVILLVSMGGLHLNEIVTGLLGVFFIGAAVVSSVLYRRRTAGAEELDAADVNLTTKV